MGAFITDTLSCDTIVLNRFVTNGNYDYNSELQSKNQSLLDKVMDSISEWFQDFFDSAYDLSDSLTTSSGGLTLFGYLLIVALVLVILALLYLMYNKKMFFFKCKKKEEEDYEVVEDSIYGVDFENDIDGALKTGNYKEAVRLTYLQCLRLLSDKELIDWRIYKTPKQYTEEFRDEVFEQFTRRYVFLRYSGCDVTEANYEEIREQKQEIDSRVADINPEPASQQEGGEDED